MSRLRSALLLSAALAMIGVMAAPASGAPKPFKNMSLESFDPLTKEATPTSDIAFWGDTAFVGNYDGLRTYDISDPASGADESNRLADFQCFGPQSDPSVWDTDDNGEADLLVQSVDRTLTGPQCGAEATAHGDPNGWEGVRLFDVSDPANPQFLRGIYLDCGSHTNTMYLDEDRNRLVVLISSYPLRPGPTCGQANFDNATNPFDGDPNSPGDPLHGVVQTVTIPLMGNAAASAAAATEGPELPVTYPGDPDNQFSWAEHGLVPTPDDPDIEPAALACHDIAVFVPLGKVAGACAEQGQQWNIDPATGLPDTSNPEWTFDRKNIDFHHSATYSWDGEVVNFIDESFGVGCPTVNKGFGRTGRMFFVDAESGGKFSGFQVNHSNKKEVPDYCSAHLGIPVPATDRYLLVNAWYTAGVDVIDFTNPRAPKQVAFYDDNGDEWSAYWYEQDGTSTEGDLNVFGTHGVEHVFHGEGEELEARGFESFLADVSADRTTLDHLNPQVQEEVIQGPGVSASASKKASASAKKATASSRQRANGGRKLGKKKRKAVLRRLGP
jgi:hypothetical protein